MPSTEGLSENDQSILLRLAAQSIWQGVKTGRPFEPELDRYASPGLLDDGASFVTLRIGKELRGCIGTLKASRPLVVDVTDNAFNAAFNDPRFEPLSEMEYGKLDLHISVLSRPELLTGKTEEDYLHQVRPGVDGLILEDNDHRGTFLPAVWEMLPNKQDFWQHLKRKAGLTAHWWSDTVRISRYHTFEFGKEMSELSSATGL